MESILLPCKIILFFLVCVKTQTADDSQQPRIKILKSNLLLLVCNVPPIVHLESVNRIDILFRSRQSSLAHDTTLAYVVPDKFNKTNLNPMAEVHGGVNPTIPNQSYLSVLTPFADLGYGTYSCVIDYNDGEEERINITVTEDNILSQDFQGKEREIYFRAKMAPVHEIKVSWVRTAGLDVGRVTLERSSIETSGSETAPVTVFEQTHNSSARYQNVLLQCSDLGTYSNTCTSRVTTQNDNVTILAYAAYESCYSMFKYYVTVEHSRSIKNVNVFVVTDSGSSYAWKAPCTFSSPSIKGQTAIVCISLAFVIYFVLSLLLLIRLCCRFRHLQPPVKVPFTVPLSFFSQDIAAEPPSKDLGLTAELTSIPVSIELVVPQPCVIIADIFPKPPVNCQTVDLNLSSAERNPGSMLSRANTSPMESDNFFERSQNQNNADFRCPGVHQDPKTNQALQGVSSAHGPAKQCVAHAFPGHAERSRRGPHPLTESEGEDEIHDMGAKRHLRDMSSLPPENTPDTTHNVKLRGQERHIS